MYKQVKYLLLVAFLLISQTTCAIFTVHSLVDTKKIGDYNQALGVFAALQKASKDEVTFQQWDVSQKDMLIEQATAQDVIIAVGAEPIKIVPHIKQKTNICVCYLSHQATHDLKSLVNCVDMVALPSHAISKKLQSFIESSKTKLVQTVGVAHNLDQTTVLQEFTEHKDVFPHKKYMCVILAGDAPEPSGKMRYFTQKQ